MSKTFKDVSIGQGKTFIIAEAGINHNGKLELALKLVDAAKESGANAIKFQTYKTEQRVAADSPIFSLLKQCELSDDQQRKIKEHADKVGILFFSTPFDTESLDFLQTLEVPLMKIASFDIVNTKLLEAVAKTQIPTIISRGMADTKEIDAAVAIFKNHQAPFALLHCISAYPTPKEDTNLLAIQSLKAAYDCPVGYSDHTLDLDASVYAVAVGARIIEKHFTLARDMEGPDHKMSVDPASLKVLSQRIRELEQMLGKGELESMPAEEGTRVYRRPS